MSFIEYRENVMEVGTTFCLSVRDELSNIVPTFWFALEYVNTSGRALISSIVPTCLVVMDCMTNTGQFMCSSLVPTYWLVHDRLKITGSILQHMFQALINAQWNDLTRERNIRLFSQNGYKIDEMNHIHSRFHYVNNYSAENMSYKGDTHRTPFQSESSTSLPHQFNESITNRHMSIKDQNAFATYNNQYNNNTLGVSDTNMQNSPVKEINFENCIDRECHFKESNICKTKTQEYKCPDVLRQYPNVVRALRINVRRRLGLNYLENSSLREVEDAVLDCKIPDKILNKTALNQNSKEGSPLCRTPMWNKDKTHRKGSKSDVLFRGIFSTASLKTDTSTSSASDASMTVEHLNTDRPKNKTIQLHNINASLDEHLGRDLFSKPKFIATKRSRIENFGSTEKNPSVCSSFIGKKAMQVGLEEAFDHYRNDDISAVNRKEQVTKTRRSSKRPNSSNRISDQKGVISKSADLMDQWTNEPSGGDELSKIPTRWNSDKPWVPGDNASPTSQNPHKQAMSTCPRPELDIPNEVQCKMSKVDNLRSRQVIAESVCIASTSRKRPPKNRQRSKSRNKRVKSAIKCHRINKKVLSMPVQPKQMTDITFECHIINKKVPSMPVQPKPMTDITFESQLLLNIQTAQRLIDDEGTSINASKDNESHLNQTMNKSDDCSDIFSNLKASLVDTLATDPKMYVQSDTIHRKLPTNSGSQTPSTSSLLETKQGKLTLRKPKISKLKSPKSKTAQLPQSKTLQRQSHKPKTPQLQSSKSNTPRLESSKSRLQQLQSSTSKTPQLQSSNPKTPQLQSSKPKTPQLQSSKPRTPQLQSSKPRTSQLTTFKPKTPKSKSSLLQVSKPETPQPKTPTPMTPTPQQQQPMPSTPKTTKVKSTESSSAILHENTVLPTHLVKENLQGQSANKELNQTENRIVDASCKPVLAKEKFSFAYTNFGHSSPKLCVHTHTPSVSDINILQDMPSFGILDNSVSLISTDVVSSSYAWGNVNSTQYGSKPLLEKESFRVSNNTNQQKESTPVLATEKLCFSTNDNITLHKNSNLANGPNRDMLNQDIQLSIGSNNDSSQQDNNIASGRSPCPVKTDGAEDIVHTPCFGSRPSFTQVFGSTPAPLASSKNLPLWTNAVESDTLDKQINPFIAPSSTGAFGSEALVGFKSFEQFSSVSEKSAENTFSFQGDNFCKYR